MIFPSPNETFSTVSVKIGKAQCEQMFSALPLRADIAQHERDVRKVPSPEEIRVSNLVRDALKSRHRDGQQSIGVAKRRSTDESDRGSALRAEFERRSDLWNLFDNFPRYKTVIGRSEQRRSNPCRRFAAP